MKSIGVTLQRHLSYKKLQRETLCDIQLSSPIFLRTVTLQFSYKKERPKERNKYFKLRMIL